MPQGYDPMVDNKTLAQISDFAASTAHVITACVDKMPTHTDFIAGITAH
jgi:tryptophan halogenase